MISLYISFAFNIYVVHVSPFTSRLKNNLEMYNEITIFYAVYSLFLFTEFNSVVENQYNCGWGTVGIVLMNMLINWGVFFFGHLNRLIT